MLGSHEDLNKEFEKVGMPTLSKKSVYENMFGVRHRGPGRPGTETMFPGDGVPELIADVARRRAYAVVHEEQRPRLREVYFIEVDVLKRRGLATVAADIGVPVPAESGSVKNVGR